MKYLEFLYMVVGAMAVIYVVFNFKDFLKSWGAWILILAKGIWNVIRWIWKKIIGIFKKG